MTLDEAIKHSEEVADEKNKEACNLYDAQNYEESRDCIWCSEEHRQLAEWLKDYKRLLEQQTCEDAISRQEVLDQTYLWSKDEFLRVTNPFDYLRKRINSLPPVTPPQKYGKWIKHPEIETSTPEYLMFYECSECGDKQCFCKSDIHKKRFCSNCGCRMVDPQESEDKDASSD